MRKKQLKFKEYLSGLGKITRIFMHCAAITVVSCLIGALFCEIKSEIDLNFALEGIRDGLLISARSSLALGVLGTLIIHKAEKGQQ